MRLGYELVHECPQPTPMLLMLNVHYTRVSDLVVPDHLVTSPSIPISAYRDGFGNWCSRIVAPTGRGTNPLAREGSAVHGQHFDEVMRGSA
jgi:hypothetical protein